MFLISQCLRGLELCVPLPGCVFKVAAVAASSRLPSKEKKKKTLDARFPQRHAHKLLSLPLFFCFFLGFFKCHRLSVFLRCGTMRQCVRFWEVRNKQQKGLLVAVGMLLHSTSLECTDKAVTRANVCPAAQPDIAGRSPNLA